MLYTNRDNTPEQKVLESLEITNLYEKMVETDSRLCYSFFVIKFISILVYKLLSHPCNWGCDFVWVYESYTYNRPFYAVLWSAFFFGSCSTNVFCLMFEAISKEGRKAMLCLVWNLWIEENAPDQFDEDFSYYD